MYLDPPGRRRLAETGTIVALCPRSNATVGIAPPPVAAYLRERVPFAVGTDSLGSNRSLDLLEDVAALRGLALDGGYAEADLDRRLLAAATVVGARSMGLDDIVGALVPDRRADLAIFAIEPDPRVVERALVESGAGRCVAVLTAGRRRHDVT